MTTKRIGRAKSPVEAMGPLVREMNTEQRPREKFLALGADRLETEELLAILLRTGRKGTSVVDLSREVINQLRDGAYGLHTVTPQHLCHIKGIGADKAVTVCAAIELGRRLMQLKVKHTYRDFSKPSAVAAYAMEKLRHCQEEQFWTAMLNSKNRLISLGRISAGGLTSSLAEQRSVFRQAIEANAAAIILLHNHPSGDPEPSSEDIRITRIFADAGKIMGIPVLDHIIIGDGIYTSLCEQGLLQ